MKKRKLISCVCVFIVMCMLSPMILTSCSSGETVENLVANRKAVTLTIYTLVEDSTTPEGLAEVEEALNEITKTRYTTQIKLIGFKRSEYEAEINRLFDVYDAEQEKQREEESIENSRIKASKDQARKDKAAGLTQAVTKKPTEPPKTTELYTERIVFPFMDANQLDIFLITSSDMFYQLAEDDRLEGMDDELNTKAKVLKEYIHPSILMSGRYGDKTLAIPTNKAIGTATYLVINKRLAEEYNEFARNFNLELASADEEEDADEDADENEDGEEAEATDKPVAMKIMDLAKVKEYGDLTAYLEWIKANKPDVALIDKPFESLKNYESLFPGMPEFAAVSSVGAVGTARSLVYTPEQEPTEAPTKAPTEPPTDEDGQVITEDPESTTIPATTSKPKNTPAVMNLEPAGISMTNKYTHTAYVNIAKLNQEYRAKGLFENSAVPAGKERAAYVAQGTLEDRLAWEAADLANGYEYEYILYGHPIAAKENIQSSMYGISVSSKVPTMRCMEIITLLNTNKKFKNTFQYGVEGVHYIYNDDGRIEYINNDYMISMDYTGNHFIADLMAGDNPNKWGIAKEHNLNVVSSVFMQFYLDKSKLTADAEEAIPKINELSKKVNEILMSGNIPAEYEDIDDYISGYVEPEFAAAGWADLNTEIKLQTNPPSDD